MPKKRPLEPLGYLVTREGHSIPLASLSPQSIQDGARNRHTTMKRHPGRKEKFGHQKALSAVIDQLGFHKCGRDQWTDYKDTHYPQFQQFLANHHCKQPGGLFPRHYGGCFDLGLNSLCIRERDLSDRLFLSDKPWPNKVFLGYGVDWSVWDSGDGHRPPEAAIKTICGDPRTAARRAEILWEYRMELLEDWNFHGDAMFGGTEAWELQSFYQSNGPEDDELMQRRKDRAAIRRKAFFDIFALQAQGWVEIIKVTDSLAILKGCDGTWQPLWKGFRDTAPPAIEGTGVHCYLHRDDTPTALADDDLIRQTLYNRREVWDGLEEIEAYKHFVEQGNSPDIINRTPSLTVRANYLRANGTLPTHRSINANEDLPPGFTVMPPLNGVRFALSNPVTVAELRHMLQQSGYQERRAPDADEFQWTKESSVTKDSYPACVCWVDAQAYCRWFEDTYNISVRLPTFAELISVRPCFSYNSMQNYNSEQSAVAGITEARGNSVSFGRLFDWQGDTALWKTAPVSTDYQGVAFYDSDDLFEFCQHSGQIVGRLLEHGGTPDKDGHCKKNQITFRLAIALDAESPEVAHG